MFPLAAIMIQKGHTVTGSDLIASKNTQILVEKFKIKVIYGEHCAQNINHLHRPDIVIYSSAVKPDNPEFVCAQNLGCRMLRRGEALAALTTAYQNLVAISGSHGKTTITAMLAYIFRSIVPAAGFLVGGKVTGWQVPSNAGDGDIFVTEADESDGSHTALHPFLSVIPNIEDDHAWSVGGVEQLYANFSQLAQQSQNVIYVRSSTTDALLQLYPHTVGYTQKQLLESVSDFSLKIQHSWPDFMLLNAALVLLVVQKLGLDRTAARNVLESFPGAARRMVLHAQREDAVLMEDYAHHPTELKAFLDGLRKIYPQWRIQVIFQPHRYARLKRYIDSFAELLREVDAVWVTPVFAAWVDKDSVDSATLVERIGPTAIYLDSNDWEAMACQIDLFPLHDKGVVTAVVGAGDIDQILPYLKKMY